MHVFLRRLLALCLLVGAAGVGASLTVAVRVDDAWRDAREQEQASRAQQFATVVEQRLNRAAMISELLAGFVAAVEGEPSREAFGRFASQLRQTAGPGVRAAVWAPRSRAVEGAVSVDGSDGYVVRYRVPEPADPAVYQEDLTASPERGPAVRRALATGLPAATDAITFYTDQVTGAAVYRAVYDADADLSTEASRLDAAAGVVAVALDVAVFVAAVDEGLPGRDFGVRLAAGNDTLASLPAPPAAQDDASSALQVPLSVAGADWRLDLALPPIVSTWSRDAWQALAAGLVTTLLATWILWTFGRRVQSSRQKLADFAEAARRVQRVLDLAPFPAIVRGEHGAILEMNKAWLDLSGYARDDMRSTADWNRRAGGGDAGNAFTDLDRLYELDRPIDEGERAIRTADGRTRQWTIRSAPVGLGPKGERLAVSMAADVTERREAEDRLQLLMQEVDHRAKNALMVVLAIVRLSKVDADNPALFVDIVEKRIQAIARAHSLLAESHWSGAPLGRLLRDELAAYAGREGVQIEGPSVSIQANAAQTVSIVLHELATNAVKYGALSNPGGRLRVRWAPDTRTGGICLEWLESGGPPIEGLPSQNGFGLLLLRQSIESQLGGSLSLDWRREGLRVELRLPAATWVANGVVDASAAETRVSATPARAGTGRVLVVEDESLTALALGQALEEAGFDVEGPAARVDDAIRIARTGSVDAAVLDVNLFGAAVTPVADALAAMGIPFLFCTGYEGGAAAGQKHPSAPLLLKPVHMEQMIAVLRDLLGRRGGATPSSLAP